MLNHSVIRCSHDDIMRNLESIEFSDFDVIARISKETGITTLKSSREFMESLQAKYNLDKYLDVLEIDETKEVTLKEVFEFSEINKLSTMIINDTLSYFKQKLEFFEALNSDDYTDVHS